MKKKRRSRKVYAPPKKVSYSFEFEDFESAVTLIDERLSGMHAINFFLNKEMKTTTINIGSAVFLELMEKYYRTAHIAWTHTNKREVILMKEIDDGSDLQLNKTEFGERGEYIGASEIGALLSLTDDDINLLSEFYHSPLELFCEKTGKKPKNFGESPQDMINDGKERLHLGKVFEDTIAQEIAQPYRLDLELLQAQPNYTHKKYDFIVAHPDYLVKTKDGTECLLEVKTVDTLSPQYNNWGIGGENIPYSVYAQVQCQMMCSGHESCIVVVGMGYHEIRSYVIAKNEQLQLELEKAACLFWNEHVLKDVSPRPMVVNDTALLAADNGARSDETVLPDEMLLEYKLACENRTKANKEAILAKGRILYDTKHYKSARNEDGSLAIEIKKNKKSTSIRFV